VKQEQLMRAIVAVPIVALVWSAGCAERATRNTTVTAEQTAVLIRPDVTLETLHVQKHVVRFADGRGLVRSYALLFGPNPDEATPGKGRFVSGPSGPWAFRVENSYVYMIGYWPWAETGRLRAGPETKSPAQLAVQIVDPSLEDVHRVYRMRSAVSIRVESLLSTDVVVLKAKDTFCEVSATGAISAPQPIESDPDARAFRDYLLGLKEGAGL